MNRIRVLELIKTLDTGGAEKLLVERLKVISKEEFDVSVAYLDPGRSTLVPDLQEIGIAVRCLHARRRFSAYWMLRLFRALKKSPVDVVHVHSPLMAVGVRIVVRALGRERPAIVTTEHSVNYHRATQFVNARTIAFDSTVIAVSNAVAGGPVLSHMRNVLVVHHGTDLGRATALRRQRLHLEYELSLPAGPRVVTVANHRPEKDLRTLLAAARIVHNSVPDAHFFVAGAGPGLESLRSEVAEHEMSSYFHLLGGLNDAVRLTACADVFALSSLREGLPVAVMEALACGVPVVATEVGGLSDMVVDGSNGYLVPCRAPDPMAARLTHLLTDTPLRTTLGASALRSSRKFDMQTTNAVVERVYREVSGARRRR